VNLPPVSRVRLAIPAAVGACALLAAAPALGGTDTRRLQVWFLRDGEPVAVSRVAPAVPSLLRSLLAGPTRAERTKGLRSAIPVGTTVRELTISRRVVTVDVGARFAAGRDEASLTARVGQLVRTLRAVPGVVGVRVRIEGGVPIGLFPGYDLRRIVRAPLASQAAPTLRETQQLLVDLGFMARSGVTGRPGDETSVAVLAFEKWTGMPRDGVLDAAVVKAIARATRPEPVRREPGKRVELLLDRQVALAIVDNEVVRVIPVSTGKATTPTPPGDFKVYAKIARWWSVPFREWLLWALPFNAGVAFHEFPEVPPYAASHGCVREFASTAKWLYDFAYVGMPVKVMAQSR